jgi:hypothetical protein
MPVMSGTQSPLLLRTKVDFCPLRAYPDAKKYQFTVLFSVA